MLQDLLVPLTGTVGDEAALSYAIALAERERAHLTALAITSLWLPASAPWSLAPSALFTRLHDESRARSRDLTDRARQRLHITSISWEVRESEVHLAPTPAAVAAQAHYADLSILAACSNGDAQAWIESFFLHLLLDSGRPVMLVPPQFALKQAPRRAVIAWQPGREASRAVHDALPLLKACDAVSVLCIEPQPTELGHGEQPGADIATHLARHGLKLEVLNQAAIGEDYAQTILRHVLESGADLLVVGGYSHSRWREQVLGGITRSLFEKSPVPVLFSH